MTIGPAPATVAARLAALYAFVNGRDCRDPDHPCQDFTEGAPDGDCETDGHYRCMECVHCDVAQYRQLKVRP